MIFNKIFNLGYVSQVKNLKKVDFTTIRTGQFDNGKEELTKFDAK